MIIYLYAYLCIFLEVLPVWHLPNKSQERSQTMTEKSHFEDDLC